MRVQVLLSALLLTIGALATPATGQSSRIEQNITFCQLATNPLAYSGKRVRIWGIYRFVLEMNDLEQPECCPDKKLENIHVSISGNPMNPDAKSKRLARRLFSKPDGVALVIFVGSLNGRTLEVDRIERIEHLARTRDREHDPSWVPRDCASTEADSLIPVNPMGMLRHPISEEPE